MHAIRLVGSDGVADLEVVTFPIPEPGPDDILVKVEAAGVNRADIILRQQNIPLPVKDRPQIPGLEISGEIVDLGKAVSGFSKGDRVCGLTPVGGGYAEYACLPASLAWPVPSTLSAKEAAALPEALLTVWNALFYKPVIQPGESLLVHGGTSGIGAIAIRLAQILGNGNMLLATAGNAQKCEALSSWGVTRAINYREEDYIEVVNRETRDKGVDVILDMVGGDYLSRNIKAAAINGRIVQIGMMQGIRGEVDIPSLMAKRLSLIGASIFFQNVLDKSRLAGDISRKVWPQVCDGAVRPVIDSVFPLDKAREAQAHMEEGHHIGKILIVCS